jgi:mRNA interferase YafQ
MKAIKRTKQFKSDIKLMQRQGKNLVKLRTVLVSLLEGEELAPEYRDHVLVGQYKGTRECHIAPDRLLIYESKASEIILIRTGSHSELFR